jgi:hypothetical protein
MGDAHGGAELILRLYEIRREDELRRARDWFAAQFFPSTVEDVVAAWRGPESARYRMVTTYWEMAATLVNHGAIPEAMFHDANTEHVAVWLKLRPHLERLRQVVKYPSYLSQLERLMTRMPDLEERSAPMQAYLEMKRRQLASAPPSADAVESPRASGAPTD